MAQNWSSSAIHDQIDIAQIVKRLEWLDTERRKDKDAMALMTEQIDRLQQENRQLSADLTEIRENVTKYSAVFAKIDQTNGAVNQLRIEAFRAIEDHDKTHTDREKEIDAARNNSIDAVNRSIIEIRKAIEPIQDLKRNLQTRTEEGYRLSRSIDDNGRKVESVAQEFDEIKRSLVGFEEGRKQDAKRITDMQTELAVHRKRTEEFRVKLDLAADNLAKSETRLNALSLSETERKNAVLALQEKVSSQNLEKEKIWTEWKKTFADIIEKANHLDTQVQMIENMNRSVKRSQDGLEETTQRFDRRTNELVEMQRLMEEKFRQEWVTFKGDDQKRWTNYSLDQNEIQSEYERNLAQLKDRLTEVETSFAVLTDDVKTRDDMQISQMQELFSIVRGWLEKMGKTN